MRLIAYDFEAIVRMAQQAPWTDGLEEARLWAGEVRRAARPEGGCGRDGVSPAAGATISTGRTFDARLLDTVVSHLTKSHEALGGKKALRDLLGEEPAREIIPGVDGWTLYEDLMRLWATIVTPPIPAADLIGANGLLAALGKTIDRDLLFTRTSPLCAGIGAPYPVTWRARPRARINHVSVGALDLLCEIGSAELDAAARTLSRPRDEIAPQIGMLIRHFELARQLDTVVAVDPDDAFWA